MRIRTPNASVAAAALCLAACSPAPPRVARPTSGSASSNLLSVSAGTFSTGAGSADASYVVDPAAKLCFFEIDQIQGGAGSGPVSLVLVDCCRIAHIAEVRTAIPELASCAQPPTPPAPPPAPVAPAPPG